MVTAALLELVLRLLPSTLRGYEFRDGSFERPTEFLRDTQTNSLGFHDVEHGVSGRRRIVLLGDSYVAATSVPLADTVGRRLEEALDAASPGHYEVISVGRPGWGQRLELDTLRKLGPALRPAVVLTLFMHLNDVRDQSPELGPERRRHNRNGVLRQPGRNSIPIDRVPVLLFPWSELNRLIAHRLALLELSGLWSDQTTEPIPFDYFVYQRDYSPAWQAAWQDEDRLIAETQGITRELGARYLVASASTRQGMLGPEAGLEALERAYPAMRNHSWDLEKPDRLMAELCARHAIPFLRLEPLMREVQARTGQQLHWKYDGHWNVEGNRVAAELLAPFVLKSGPD